MTRPAVFGVFAVALLVVSTTATVPRAGAAPDNPPVAGPAMVGLVAPPFQATRLSGPDPSALRDLRGRVVVLDFWATWCGPCQSVMPLLDGLHRRYHGQGLTVLGISDESRPVIQRHLQRNPVAYTVAQDVQGTGRSFGIRAIPTLVIIDRQGKVREVYAGLTGARMRNLVQIVPQLLAEPMP